MTKQMGVILSVCALVMFAALSAVRDVWAKILFRDHSASPIFLTWLCCALTFVVFYCTASVWARRPYSFQDCRQAAPHIKLRIVGLNICTFIAFLTTLMAINALDAYLNAIIDYGASPVITACLAVMLRKERLAASALIGMFVSFCGILILFVGQARFDWGMLGGVGLSVASCLALGVVHVWNKDVIQSGIERDRAIISRLPLSILILGVATWSMKAHVPDVNPVELLLWAFLGVSIPLLLLAYAFEHLQVKHVAFFMFLIPVFTFVGGIWTRSFIGNVIAGIVGGVIVLLGVVVSEYVSLRRPMARFERRSSSAAELEASSVG